MARGRRRVGARKNGARREAGGSEKEAKKNLHMAKTMDILLLI
jgi:hypothetical protein